MPDKAEKVFKRRGRASLESSEPVGDLGKTLPRLSPTLCSPHYILPGGQGTQMLIANKTI